MCIHTCEHIHSLNADACEHILYSLNADAEWVSCSDRVGVL